MHDVSQWLHLIALGSLGLASFCAAAIFAYILRYPVNGRLLRAGIKEAM